MPARRHPVVLPVGTNEVADAGEAGEVSHLGDGVAAIAQQAARAFEAHAKQKSAKRLARETQEEPRDVT